eukprot:6192082-Pleurochrysis_carterae.AAC.1
MAALRGTSCSDAQRFLDVGPHGVAFPIDSDRRCHARACKPTLRNSVPTVSRVCAWRRLSMARMQCSKGERHLASCRIAQARAECGESAGGFRSVSPRCTKAARALSVEA